MDVFCFFDFRSYFKNNPIQITIVVITVASISLFRKWMAGKTCSSSKRLDGKTVIITGANTGIGKETALELNKRGASVILACRDVRKGEKAVNDIQLITGSNDIKCLQLDLASFESIRKFSEEVLKSEPQIHILINNAGLACTPYQKTEDGYEMQFGVNHLGHFLLTLLLLHRIKDSAPARIINVSSIAYKGGKINFNDLNSEKTFKPFAAYFQSKLANIYFTRELAKRLVGTNITTYCLHPGVINTELNRYMGSSMGYLFSITFSIISKLVFKTPKQGAQTTIYCAVAEELAKESGYYYENCGRAKLKPCAEDDTIAKKLWRVSEEMTGVSL